jgi:hypothetical protein
MGRIWLLSATLLLSVGLGTAHAFPQDHLAAAREALKVEDRKAARSALEQAQEAFANAEGVAPNDVLASYWYYRALLVLGRGKSKVAMEQFRQALVVDNDYLWDKELSKDKDARRLFEALRNEVRSRDVQSPKVPEKMGMAQAYVDGTRVRAGDWVSVGPRLAQIQCPEGDVYGEWTSFEEEVDWLALCPGGVDTSVDVYAVTGPADEFSGLDTFGAASPDAATAPPEAVESPAPEKVAESESPAVKNESEGKFALAELATPQNIVIGVGGGMMVGGIVLHLAVVKPSLAMVEWGRRNTHELSRSQAEILTSRFVARRRATWAVFGVGAGLTAAGVFGMKPTSLQPMVFPGGFGLQGGF